MRFNRMLCGVGVWVTFLVLCLFLVAGDAGAQCTPGVRDEGDGRWLNAGSPGAVPKALWPPGYIVGQGGH